MLVVGCTEETNLGTFVKGLSDKFLVMAYATTADS